MGAAAASAAAAAATRCWMPTSSQPSDAVQSAAAGVVQAPILRLADWVQEPEVPTIGSAGHHSRNCKPCAFYHTKGCGNGSKCNFCHLCPADEKKRRQKEKVAAQREMRRMRL